MGSGDLQEPPPTRQEELSLLTAAREWLRAWARRVGSTLYDELFPVSQRWLPHAESRVTLRRPVLIEGIAYLSAAAHLLFREGVVAGAFRPRDFPRCLPFAAKISFVVEGLAYFNITAGLIHQCLGGSCCKGWRPSAQLLRRHTEMQIRICCAKAATCMKIA